MWANVGRVIGAEAAVSIMMAKSKLGGLVRHQRVEATGVDLTLDTVTYAQGDVHAKLLYEWVLLMCMYAIASCFPSWRRLLGIIHETRPISHSACATHVFLFNLLVFSSSATTRMLPAIFFPARDKRITDVSAWNVPFPPPLPFPSSCTVTSLRQPLHSYSLLSSLFPLFCFPKVCPSLIRYVGT